MKLLITPKNKNIASNDLTYLLPLKDYAVDYETYYTLEEIIDIATTKEIFVVINKTIFNDDINKLIDILKEIARININGVFFYDLAILEIVNTYNIKIPLVWNQTHMVTNYKTCNFYKDNNVSYAVISNELSKKEIIDITNLSKMKFIYQLFLKPQVAHSRRKLITNQEIVDKKIVIEEKITTKNYIVQEDNNGTSFIYDKILNNYSLIDDINVDYLLLKSDFIKEDIFNQVLDETIKYLNKEITSEKLYTKVVDIIGDEELFLPQETIVSIKKGSKEDE